MERVILTHRYQRQGRNLFRIAVLCTVKRERLIFLWNYRCQIDRSAQQRWREGMAVGRPSYAELTGLAALTANDALDFKRAADIQRATCAVTWECATIRGNPQRAR
jgi:hypothetical protein